LWKAEHERYLRSVIRDAPTKAGTRFAAGLAAQMPDAALDVLDARVSEARALAAAHGVSVRKNGSLLRASRTWRHRSGHRRRRRPTTSPNGGLHFDIRGNAQGVVATGATSGDSYRLAGDFWSEQTVRNASYPLVLTVVEVHNAVSAGSAQNFIVHIVRHLTIDANGIVTASVDAVSAECQG
jgi:hypothetical protein